MNYLVAITAALLAFMTELHACEVTRDQFNRLQNGMPYSQVVSVLGCQGREQLSMSMGSGDVTNYVWQGVGGGSLLITMAEGVLFAKMQSGLR